MALTIDGSDPTGDLGDLLGSKPTKTFGTAAPGSPTNGDIWYDTNATPPESKFWDGSAWQNFSAGAANFSDAATGTYTDSGINYKYIVYNSSGTLTCTRSGLADVLVVGGGGGGGGGAAGGGAGGHYYATDVYLQSGSLSVTVGAGGANQTEGTSSRIGDLFGVAGGCSPDSSSNGTFGGSGGGGGRAANVGGAGTSGQGNTGGNAASGAGGGGGGSSAVGANASTNAGGNGGAGSANSITGSSVTRGGGGGGWGSSSAGSGGSGGGGAGQVSGTGTAGTGNTGGGGGAGGSAGGAGGSGVVIIRVRT